MNFSRQIREELTKDFSFLGSSKPDEIPKPKPVQETKALPQAPRISSKGQIESLKNSLDLQAQQKKVENFSKFQNNSKLSPIQEFEVTESRSSQSTPDFCKIYANQSKNKFIRTEFPKSLASEFNFFDSPTGKNELMDFIRLTDERIGREESFDVIERLSKRLR